MCQSATVFYQPELASSFQMQEKLKACMNSNEPFRVAVPFKMRKIIWLHVVVFT